MIQTIKHTCTYIKSLLIAGIAVLPILISAAPAYAETNKADLEVGMKVLPLLSDKLNGPTKLIIIFNPANADSKEEAQGIKAILDGSFEMPGDIKLIPVLVPVNNLALAEDSKIAIITSGLDKNYDDISRVSAKNKILTMSTDLSCVESRKCIIGIVSKPRVEIYYSPAAAASAGISFAPAFIMLVKQI